MPLLVALVSVLGAAAFWYYRMRDLGMAASELVDTTQRVRGAYRRRSFRKKAEASAISSIDDPAIAAAAFLIALGCERGALSPAAEDAIKTEIRSRMGMGMTQAEEIFIFARWAADHATGPNDLILRFSPLWKRKLEISELRDLCDMALQVAAIDGAPTPAQATSLKTLSARLGLT